MYLTLYTHPNPMNPFKQLEKTQRSRTLCRLIDLVGKASF